MMQDSALGFWVSFSCTYDTNTHAWGKQQGYGLQHDHAYCLAEPTYKEAIKKRVLDVVRTYDMAVISFDGMHLGQGLGCNQAGHGHLTSNGPDAGKYATEAVADAELEIYSALRKLKPDINIDFFVCGEWASPWWLTVVDGIHCVKGDTVGCDIPSPSLRDELITARGIQVFWLLRHQKRPFPLWAVDAYGSQVRKDHLIDRVVAVNEDYSEKWENELVLSLAGRGTITSYIACSDLPYLGQTRTGMKFLAEVVQWVRHHRVMYRHTNLILGEPGRGQVYGYAHGDREGRSIVAVHNPAIDTRQVSIAIDEQLDLAKTQDKFRVNMIYPYRATWPLKRWGESIDFSAHGYEAVMLDIRRENLPGPVFDSFRQVDLPKPDIQISAPATKENEIVLQGEVQIPSEHHQPELLVYLRPEKKMDYHIDTRVNGRKVNASIRHRTRRNRQEAWFFIPLKPGDNRLRLSMAGANNNQLGAWVRSVLPDPTKAAKPANINEPLFPILPAESRSRYWPALKMREISIPRK